MAFDQNFQNSSFEKSTEKAFDFTLKNIEPKSQFSKKWSKNRLPKFKFSNLRGQNFENSSQFDFSENPAKSRFFFQDFNFDLKRNTKVYHLHFL